VGNMGLLRQFERGTQSLAELLHFQRREGSHKVREVRFRKADELIAMDAAFMLETFFYPDSHLRGQPIMPGIKRSANDGGKLGLNQGLTAHHDKDSRPLRIMRRGVGHPIQVAAPHVISMVFDRTKRPELPN
jgi:hypothetical protein